MKIQILSDLHLELTNMTVQESDADVILLPCDIWKGDSGIYWARATWPDKPILYVAGNHEFYGKNRFEVLAKLRIAARETNVHFLDNDEVIIDNVRFLGATMWTDFNLNNDKYFDIATGQNRLSDFSVIHEDNAHFSPLDSIDLHKASIAWLTKKLDEGFDGRTVVVTHHLSSMLSVHARFSNNVNEIFRTQGYRRHHALDDAIVNKLAYEKVTNERWF